MDPRQQILNFIVEQLENISVGAGYTTDMQRVLSGKIIQTDKFSEADRRALTQIRFVSQSNSYSGQITLDAEAVYAISASMTNATHDMFVGFLGDIESALAKSLHMDLFSPVFNVGHYYISSITIVGSTEYDELNDTFSPDIREQIAEMELSVNYTYIPEILSGS
mgnify:FL=1